MRPGEAIQDVFVAEEGARYSPGASAELGSSGSPGTFGTARIDGGLRIVWHYGAFSEVRTFTVGYRLVGVAVAYDDVVDVNLKGAFLVGLLMGFRSSAGLPAFCQRRASIWRSPRSSA